MDEPQDSLVELGREADDLMDQVDIALEEHAPFRLMLETRAKVDALSQRYKELIATVAEPARAQIERTVGRKVVDVQKMSTRLPAE